MTKDNITMAAVKAYFTSVSGAEAGRKDRIFLATKYSSVTFEERAYVLGAPEFVLLDEYEAYEAKIIQSGIDRCKSIWYLELMTVRSTERL
ncbi:MAG: hypothetical protein ACLUVD_07575 [Mediterraneibacter faecis]